MRTSFHPAIEAGRMKVGVYATESGERQGMFHARAPNGERLRIMVSDGTDWELSGLELPAWEHVSVSCERRCPTWQEMHWVKEQFWNDDETVIQFHPPRSDYVNFAAYCLHLWKPIGVEIPRPHHMTVGPKAVRC